MPRPSQDKKSRNRELTNEISAIKKKRILEEACRQFFEKGYDNTSLDSIAEGLGFTKPFIYSRFEGKADLLAAVSKAGADATLQAVEYAASIDADPATQLATLVNRFSRSQIDRHAEVAVYFREVKNMPPDAAEYINKIKTDFHKKLAGIIKAGVEAGQFRVDDVSVAAAAIGGLGSWTFTWWKPGGRLSAEAVSRQLTQLALNLVQCSAPMKIK